MRQCVVSACMVMVIVLLASACGGSSAQSGADSVATFDPLGATPSSSTALATTQHATTAPPSSSSSSSQSTSQSTSTAPTGSTTSTHSGPIRATFIGDSVPAAIDYVPAAQRRLKKGLKLNLDLDVCRRLVEESCTYDGNTPATALQEVQRFGSSLGNVLIVDVGYNDYSGTYRDDMRKVIHAADADGVDGIVWVTMREARSSYDWTNHVIKTEAHQFPNVVVADWNKRSTGEPWFGSDGLHLNDAGATHLARFLKPYIYAAAQKSQ